MSFEHWKLLIGMVAALCGTVTLLPQLLKMWRYGARDVSYPMLYLYLLTVLLWLVYGMMTKSLPLTVSNASAMCLASACIGTKWKSDRAARLRTHDGRSSVAR
jgi:MtN3 and saliva related transmembrane protein